MNSHYLCSFTPLGVNKRGRAAADVAGLPWFIDGSCRREPDFENSRPSISALCRAWKFVPRNSGSDPARRVYAAAALGSPALSASLCLESGTAVGTLAPPGELPLLRSRQPRF